MKLKFSGFTLIELIITITLIGIMAAVTGVFIINPMRAYNAVANRADLVHQAEITMRRIERDIKRAVPNSIRVKNGGNAIEMLNSVAAFRYRSADLGAFNIDPGLLSFNILGTFPDNMDGNNYRVVVYNLGAYNGNDYDDPISGSNVYSVVPGVANVISPITATTSGSSVTFNSGVQFSYFSPQKRVYFADTPITYICEANNVIRFWNYPIDEIQPANKNIAPLNTADSALLADKMQQCTFSYDPGSAQRNATVTININIGSGDNIIKLLHQVEVNNAP